MQCFGVSRDYRNVELMMAIVMWLMGKMFAQIIFLIFNINISQLGSELETRTLKPALLKLSLKVLCASDSMKFISGSSLAKSPERQNEMDH